MNINNCFFPDHLLYDLDNFTWVNYCDNDLIKLGITPIITSLSGKLKSIKIKDIGSSIEKGKSVASIESSKYFGIIRTPFSGIIKEINNDLLNNPKLANNSPYEKGWFIKILLDKQPFENNSLEYIRTCENKIRFIINDLKVKCFKEFPDYEMYEIGQECAATLNKLDELLTRINIGEIVYLVSDDITADLELLRWSDNTSQPIIDLRKENSLFHFLIKKER